MKIDADVVLYADVPLVGCVLNTIGYCCLRADVGFTPVSGFLRFLFF